MDASKYVDKFVIMNLLPLSSEQQRRIIQVQMEDNEFFDNLFATRWELFRTECITNQENKFAFIIPHCTFPTLSPTVT